MRWLYRAAAAVIAIIAIIWFFYPPDEQPSIASLIKPPTDLTQASQTQDPGEGNYRNGKIQYKNERYAPAIQSLEQVPAESKYYHVSRFLLAHCYLYAGIKPQEAVSIFESFKNEMDPASKLAGEYDYDPDKVKWNLMLAYKAAGLQDQYSKWLQDLSNNPDYIFQREAIELRTK
jgi:hypothetical protein